MTNTDLGETIKIENMPVEGEFQVVQVLIRGELVMYCAHNDHSEMLETILRKHEIQPNIKTIKTMFGEKDLPELYGDNYTVLGMGRSKIKTSTKQFQLPYDRSKDYNIGPDYTFRKILENQFSDWKIGTI